MPVYSLEDIEVVSEFPGVKHRFIINKASGATGSQLGEVVLEPGASLPPHYHEVDDAMFVVSGKGRFIEGDDEKEIKEGMVILAPAFTKHGIKNDSNNELRIIFTWPTAEKVKRLFKE